MLVAFNLICRKEGVIRKGNLYMISMNAQRPEDNSTSTSVKLSIRKLLHQIDEKASELLINLTSGEVDQKLYDNSLLNMPTIPTPLKDNILPL